MEYQIEGKLAQSVRLTMKEGEECWASRGSLMALDQGVRWKLKVPGGIEGVANHSEVILSSHQPGKVIAWDLDESPALTTRGSFMPSLRLLPAGMTGGVHELIWDANSR